eukprot:5408105-Prymnesium_polylepis.1
MRGSVHASDPRRIRHATCIVSSVCFSSCIHCSHSAETRPKAASRDHEDHKLAMHLIAICDPTPRQP